MEIYEERRRLDQMNEKDLLKEVEYHFRDLVNTKDTCEELQGLVKELEADNENLRNAIVHMPGADHFDDVDLESLK